MVIDECTNFLVSLDLMYILPFRQQRLHLVALVDQLGHLLLLPFSLSSTFCLELIDMIPQRVHFSG